MRKFLLTCAMLAIVIMFAGCSKPTAKSTINLNSESGKTNGSDNREEKSIKPEKTEKTEKNEVTLNKDLKRKLNLFLSNFTEVHLRSFKKGQIDNLSLVHFGVEHNKINNFKELFKPYGNPDEYKYSLDKSYVESSARKYFGNVPVKHESGKYTAKYSGFSSGERYDSTIDYDVEYSKNGYIENAPGAPYERAGFIAQINKMEDLGNNTFRVYFDIYNFNDNSFVGDEYAPKEEWKINKDDKNFGVVESMNAVIEKKSDGNYILLEYLENK